MHTQKHARNGLQCTARAGLAGVAFEHARWVAPFEHDPFSGQAASSCSRCFCSVPQRRAFVGADASTSSGSHSARRRHTPSALKPALSAVSDQSGGGALSLAAVVQRSPVGERLIWRHR